jgi:DNA-binding MltR family transcriptional regulator
MPHKKVRLPDAVELLADVGRFFQDVQRETDRGIALVSAAFLDDAVQALIRAALTADSRTAEGLFGYPGPLHSFAARTDLAYCMGLIGNGSYQDMLLIRNLRNNFAHGHRPATFDDPEVRQKCARLRAASAYGSLRSDARSCFIVAVVLLANGMLLRGLLETKHAESGADFSLGAGADLRLAGQKSRE